MLQTAGELNTPLGNLIAVAAMVDDVLSLVILAVLQRLSVINNDDVDGESNTNVTTSMASTSMTSTSTSLTSTEVNVWLYMEPVVMSIVLIVCGIVLTKVIPTLVKKIPWRTDEQREVGVVVFMLLVTSSLVIAASEANTTILLGAFLGGMAFANVPKATDYWSYFTPTNELLTTIFFATIGLVIPVQELFDPLSIGYGLLYCIPAVFGKLVTGAFMKEWGNGLVVGWAMVGRGELGFLMAQESLENELVDKETFIASVWALLVCTLISPLLMRWALRRKRRKGEEEEGGGDDCADEVEVAFQHQLSPRFKGDGVLHDSHEVSSQSHSQSPESGTPQQQQRQRSLDLSVSVL
eukprot:m.224615 g.224615  ORF g.224615 m.224615 type:complete len:352 (+) comp13854_c0_seq1:430-1485(+)